MSGHPSTTEVTLADGRRLHVDTGVPHQLRVRVSPQLDVVLTDPPSGGGPSGGGTGTVARDVGDWVDVAFKIWEIVKGKGGGGGGGGQQCTQTITSVTQADGSIITTITTTCHA